MVQLQSEIQDGHFQKINFNIDQKWKKNETFFLEMINLTEPKLYTSDH